jgi:hypothetical protein
MQAVSSTPTSRRPTRRSSRPSASARTTSRRHRAAATQAAERPPVTSHARLRRDRQGAEGLLNKRGVPFTAVNVEEPANAEPSALTGG